MFSSKCKLSMELKKLFFCMLLSFGTSSGLDILECLQQWDCVWINEIPFTPTEGKCLFKSTESTNPYREAQIGPAKLLAVCDESAESPSTMFQCLALLSKNAQIRSLRLFSCDQLTIDAGDLELFPFLEEFNVSHGSIKSIDENALKTAENLTTIDIYQDYFPNGIQEYPLALIGPTASDPNTTKSLKLETFLPNLRNLILKNFVFRSGIPQHAFQNLADLNVLSLRSNSMKNSDFIAMTKLTHLRYLQVIGSVEVDVMPTELFSFLPNLVSLDLSSNYISEILENDFVTLINLQVLTLQSTQIGSIHPLAFQTLGNLSTLNLNGNVLLGLRNIYPSFQGLFRLENLYMELCFYTNISENIFKHVQNLKVLSLRDNRLREIPIIFANFPFFQVTLAEIEFLDFSHNHITYLFALLFSNLRNLKSIDLSYNFIQVIEGGTFYNLAEIEEILLKDNNIIYFDSKAFQYIQTLQLLDISWNFLANFPSFPNDVNWQLGIDGLPQNPFQTYLEGNALSCNCEMFYDLFVYNSNTNQWTLPYYSINIWPGAFNLSNQRFADRQNLLCHTAYGVDLVDSMLQTPASFYSIVTHNCSTSCVCYYQCLTQFTFAICRNSNLSEVPKDLGPAITGIDLQENLIKNLTVKSFTHLPNLQTINLGNNSISSIEGGTFYHLRYLVAVILNNNKLSSVDSETLNMSSLLFTKLDLSDNCISQIENDTFHSVSTMTWLDLKHNELQSIPKGVLDNIHNLSYLTISGNPFNCSCEILYLTEWYKETVFEKELDLFTDIGDLGCAPLLNETGLYDWLVRQEIICDPLPTADTVTKLVNVTQTAPVSWKDQWEILVGCIGATVTITVFTCGMIYKYRLEILVLIYIKTGLKPFVKRNNDEDKEYDAFISFSSLDRDFILQELVPRLEGQGSGRKLCIHHRDFLVGECIATNIVNAIEKSKRIVILCSNNYLKSEWCSYEFKTSQALKDRHRRIVLIMMEDINEKDLDKEIKAYISTNTYLDKKDSLFWSKLMYAIPETKEVTNAEDFNMKETERNNTIGELEII